MDLDHLVHVDAGQPQGDQDLDHELVAGRRGEVGRGAQPLRQFVRTLRGDVEPLLGTVLVGVVGLDQAVTLEALQGRVHLPDVQRPDLTGPGLEFLPELQPVLRTLAQKGQQGVADAHERSFRSSILSILLKSGRPSSNFISPISPVTASVGRSPVCQADVRHLL